jgi:hypothetical protein
MPDLPPPLDSDYRRQFFWATLLLYGSLGLIALVTVGAL